MGKNDKQDYELIYQLIPRDNENSLEINVFYQPLSPLSDPGSGSIEHNAAVMHNLIARAVTRWSLEESKLFICALSQIRGHDENGWIKLTKKDLNSVLDYKNRSSKWLRRITKNIAQNSWLHFETEEGWDDGFIVNRTRSDRWNIYIRFEKDYLPLLEELTSHFTKVYVESIARLNHKASYSLYLYLMSWADPAGNMSNRYIYKRDIHSIFNLAPGSYVKNPNTDKERFDWYNFERYCLIPAVEDINRNEKGEIEIFEIRKIKSSKNSHYVDGYFFTFRVNKKYVNSLSEPKAIEYRPDKNKKTDNRVAKSDELPTYEEVKEFVSPWDVNAPEVYKRLAEQHHKRNISNWKSYVEKIVHSLKEEKGKKKNSDGLPDWYTYTPTEKASSELVLQTFVINMIVRGEDPFDKIEELMKVSKLPKEKIIYYLENPDKLEEAAKD